MNRNAERLWKKSLEKVKMRVGRLFQKAQEDWVSIQTPLMGIIRKIMAPKDDSLTL